MPRHSKYAYNGDVDDSSAFGRWLLAHPPVVKHHAAFRYMLDRTDNHNPIPTYHPAWMDTVPYTNVQSNTEADVNVRVGTYEHGYQLAFLPAYTIDHTLTVIPHSLEHESHFTYTQTRLFDDDETLAHHPSDGTVHHVDVVVHRTEAFLRLSTKTGEVLFTGNHADTLKYINRNAKNPITFLQPLVCERYTPNVGWVRFTPTVRLQS